MCVEITFLGEASERILGNQAPRLRPHRDFNLAASRARTHGVVFRHASIWVRLALAWLLSTIFTHVALSVFGLARELVTPVGRLDDAGYYLAAVLVQHLKEDTIFAVVHALCRGLVVHFFLGELFFACHWFLSEVVHAEGIEPPCPKGAVGLQPTGFDQLAHYVR